jgi:hypothetical protein
MSDSIKWDVARKSLRAAIRVCSRSSGKTAKPTLALIKECAQTFKEALPDKPHMLGEVLGEYLAEAVVADKPDAVTHLVDLGASIEWRNEDGMTPLQVAAVNGKYEMIELLAKAGADLDAAYTTEHHHYTALHIAVDNEQPDAVSVLLNLGADAEAEDELDNHKTPLHMAAARPASNMSGSSPPGEEARRANENMTLALVNLFINAGVDPKVGNPKGGFPLHFAIAHAKSDKVALTLLEAATYEPLPLNYALWLAVGYDQQGVIGPLVEAGANLFDEHDGETLQEYAEKRNGVTAQKTTQLINALVTEASIKDAMPVEAESSVNSRPRSLGTPSL